MTTWAEKQSAITDMVSEQIAINVVERRRAVGASDMSPEEMARELARIDGTIKIVMFAVLAKALTLAYGGGDASPAPGKLH